MSQFNLVEKRIFQVLVVILAIICFIPGGGGAFGGLNVSSSMAGGELLFTSESNLRGFVDNQYRFGFGVFFTQGLVLLFFLRNIQQHANLFRFAALSLFIGGFARATNIIEFGIVDSAVVAPTVIELGVIPLLLLWHQRLIKKLNLREY
ncbi:DUF4345 domain-containing protein [Aliikangiella coralliicola]|uniref:DUF4345 domain-containing protein n=1 Tax=Aliikangiella coralliicola TaxID=2592383 RepID=A0A545UE84_9GAMM|nr:DUF4345 domain-containing protein [Aliikangiella coralliicola]TQV87779.1 DUF4345 domain-containing protein [Aliikangiella coralliicola]